jgi:hypothetical protein
MFHRVLPSPPGSDLIPVMDVYGNRYNLAAKVVLRTKNFEKIDS